MQDCEHKSCSEFLSDTYDIEPLVLNIERLCSTGTRVYLAPPLLPAVSLKFLRRGKKMKVAGISMATEQILLDPGLYL